MDRPAQNTNTCSIWPHHDSALVLGKHRIQFYLLLRSAAESSRSSPSSRCKAAQKQRITFLLKTGQWVLREFFWYLWGADHVLARHGQRRDVHGDAAVHVERPDQEETPTAHDGSAQNQKYLLLCFHRNTCVERPIGPDEGFTNRALKQALTVFHRTAHG